MADRIPISHRNPMGPMGSQSFPFPCTSLVYGQQFFTAHRYCKFVSAIVTTEGRVLSFDPFPLQRRYPSITFSVDNYVTAYSMVAVLLARR